jgi:hypothetical protein
MFNCAGRGGQGQRVVDLQFDDREQPRNSGAGSLPRPAQGSGQFESVVVPPRFIVTRREVSFREHRLRSFVMMSALLCLRKRVRFRRRRATRSSLPERRNAGGIVRNIFTALFLAVIFIYSCRFTVRASSIR